jgi:DNA repair exonuclease SbcCD ATPase subunit
MKRIALMTGCLLLFCHPLWSQVSQADYDRLEQECLEEVTGLNADIAKLQDALEAQQLQNQKADALIERMDEIRSHSEDLMAKYERMLALSDSTDSLLRQNVDLLKESKEELTDAIVDLNDKYNKAVKECLKPFYLRLELYTGLVVGALFGLLL